MRGPFEARLALAGVGLLVPVLLGLACSPMPINEPVGWNGRGMPLPPETGAGGDRGPGTGEAGAGSDTGAAGVGASAGAAGIGSNAGAAGVGSSTGAAGVGPSTGAAGTGAGSGAAGSMNGAAGRTSTPDAGTSGAAGTSAPPRDAGAGGTSPGMGLVNSTCRLDVAVTRKDTGRGSYAPRNVGAIWVETGAGKFVKSLNVWASKRINHLDRWNSSTTAAGLSRNRVDAVTGSTMNNHGTRTATWNCTDTNKQPVSVGAYQVCFDLNDTNNASVSNCVPVTLGPTAATVMPPDSLPSFTARRLTFTP